ncbi:MAG TPA: DUF494 family protein [Candidatus Hydrogenedentes bacterium]|nr:DUF494 family protein [Candidatus Hydrogenedentota bacterium]HOS04265.1 DUF494 family protein [Candidatus Hydrogenedentota bacterium]
MKQTLNKLVGVILKHLDDHPESIQTEHGVRTWLQRQGYNKRDIEAALKLVRPRFTPYVTMIEHRPMNVRVLSHQESQKLTPEARQALERLEYYGLIDPYEREMILERLGTFEGEVDLDALDYLLTWLVLSGRDVESQQTIYGVFEGQPGTFH